MQIESSSLMLFADSWKIFSEIVAPFGVVSYVLYTLFLIPGSTHSRLEARDVGDFLRREVCGLQKTTPKKAV